MEKAANPKQGRRENNDQEIVLLFDSMFVKCVFNYKVTLKTKSVDSDSYMMIKFLFDFLYYEFPVFDQYAWHYQFPQRSNEMRNTLNINLFTVFNQFFLPFSEKVDFNFERLKQVYAQTCDVDINEVLASPDLRKVKLGENGQFPLRNTVAIEISKNTPHLTFESIKQSGERPYKILSDMHKESGYLVLKSDNMVIGDIKLLYGNFCPLHIGHKGNNALQRPSHLRYLFNKVKKEGEKEEVSDEEDPRLLFIDIFLYDYQNTQQKEQVKNIRQFIEIGKQLIAHKLSMMRELVNIQYISSYMNCKTNEIIILKSKDSNITVEVLLNKEDKISNVIYDGNNKYEVTHEIIFSRRTQAMLLQIMIRLIRIQNYQNNIKYYVKENEFEKDKRAIYIHAKDTEQNIQARIIKALRDLSDMIQKIDVGSI